MTEAQIISTIQALPGYFTHQPAKTVPSGFDGIEKKEVHTIGLNADDTVIVKDFTYYKHTASGNCYFSNETPVKVQKDVSNFDQAVYNALDAKMTQNYGTHYQIKEFDTVKRYAVVTVRLVNQSGVTIQKDVYVYHNGSTLVVEDLTIT